MSFFKNQQADSNIKVGPKNPEQPGEIALPSFKIYYKAVIFKGVSYWYKDKQVEQQSRIESPEADMYILSVTS